MAEENETVESQDTPETQETQEAQQSTPTPAPAEDTKKKIDMLPLEEAYVLM